MILPSFTRVYGAFRRPLEHDYIGLSKFSSMENSDKHRLPLSSIVSTLSTQGEINSGLNLKETELRLGIPGSEREPGNGVSLFGKNLERNCSSRYSTGSLKASASGAKRVFSDAIDGCGKWVLSINGVSEVNLVENKNTQETPSLKEALASSSKLVKEKQPQVAEAVENGSVPAANLQGTENQSFCSRAQMVGWPPIRSFRKNTMVSTSTKHEEGTEDKSGLGCLYVKVSMDGAPYLRKVDLKAYSNYIDLSSALDDMFSCFTIGQYSSHGFSSCDGRCESFFSDLLHNSDHVLTYEDKDGDWMLVGDVPWKMFIVTCKRLRIVKGSEAIGLAPGAPEKSGTVDTFREFNGVRRAVLQEPLK